MFGARGVRRAAAAVAPVGLVPAWHISYGMAY